MNRIVAKIPIGRLIQNTHGQPMVVVMIPPTAGPMIAGIAVPTTLESRAARLSAVRIEAVIVSCSRVIGGSCSSTDSLSGAQFDAAPEGRIRCVATGRPEPGGIESLDAMKR